MFAFTPPKPSGREDGPPVCAACGQDCYGLPLRSKLDPALIPYCSVKCRPVADTPILLRVV